jgi:hypothetical protein
MIVSLTIVRYRKAFIPFALLAMVLHRLPMALQKGCTFWKLMGSGRNGTFDLQPDWQQWGLLAVWTDIKYFTAFSESSVVGKWWRVLTQEQWTIMCEPLQSHGKWSGKEPFSNPGTKDHAGPVAILTRATIRLNKLKGFWGNVDNVANIMRHSPGFITSFGIGEAPIYRQATFSVWKSMNDAMAFAYASPEHAEVIRKTRAENWYSEELFARFKIINSFGTINGIDPLAGINT